ncbi:MAG: hypothetical protein HC883_00180 [Bdellovibrionaceae bacterium]|nr:hypothetical protein [Pseudobdellovibrionaceae bacterium]
MTQKQISNKIRKLIHEGYGQKQAVAIAFSLARKKKERSMKKNPIADKDIAQCLAALAGMIYNPDRCEDVPEHILDALESEGLWNYDDGVTEKGRQFLLDAGWDEADEFSD